MINFVYNGLKISGHNRDTVQRETLEGHNFRGSVGSEYFAWWRKLSQNAESLCRWVLYAQNLLEKTFAGGTQITILVKFSPCL